MIKKLSMCFLMIFCFLYIFAAKKCECEPTTVHWQNCEEVPGISCKFNVSDAQRVVQNLDSAEMQISVPSWLNMGNPGNQILFATFSKDLDDKPIGTVKLTPISSLTGGSTSISKIIVSPELKTTFQSFLDKVKPNEDVYFQLSMPFEAVSLEYVTEDVYGNFQVSTMLFLNGVTEYEYSFEMSMASFFSNYLSSAIDQIPSSAFVNEPDQKRKVLHNKLNAAINAFLAKNPKGAYQQITKDIIPKIQEWVIDGDYKISTLGAFGKTASFLEPLL